MRYYYYSTLPWKKTAPRLGEFEKAALQVYIGQQIMHRYVATYMETRVPSSADTSIQCTGGKLLYPQPLPQMDNILGV